MQLMCHLHSINGATTVLRHNDICFARPRVVFVLTIWTIQQHHYVRILFQGTRLTKIRNLGAFIRARLWPPVQLGNRHQWYIEFLRQEFQLAGEFRHLLLPRLGSFAAAHQLKIINHNHLQVCYLLEFA